MKVFSRHSSVAFRQPGPRVSLPARGLSAGYNPGAGIRTSYSRHSVWHIRIWDRVFFALSGRKGTGQTRVVPVLPAVLPHGGVLLPAQTRFLQAFHLPVAVVHQGPCAGSL